MVEFVLNSEKEIFNLAFLYLCVTAFLPFVVVVICGCREKKEAVSPL